MNLIILKKTSFQNTIQSKIIENRVSLNLTENIEQVFNIKGTIFVYLMNKKQKFTF